MDGIIISAGLILFALLVLFLFIVLAKATYIISQAEVVLIERFGKFHQLLTSGIHFVVPFMDQPRVTYWTFLKDQPGARMMYRYVTPVTRLDLRESVYDFPKQNVITRDNVTMEINALLYYQITDPKRAVYEVSDLPQAIEKLTQTTLRNVIGSLDLDETLTSRDQVNTKLRIILDEATDKWGVKVNRVELQEVNPPLDIRNAMEKQMRAERDRRALILEAEGKKSAAILTAQGEMEAAIMCAEGAAQARLKHAQAEAEAITMILRVAPNSDPFPYLIAINYLRVLPEMTRGGEGKTVVIPYEAAGLMGAVSGLKELLK